MNNALKALLVCNSLECGASCAKCPYAEVDDCETTGLKEVKELLESAKDFFRKVLIRELIDDDEASRWGCEVASEFMKILGLSEDATQIMNQLCKESQDDVTAEELAIEYCDWESNHRLFSCPDC